LPVSLSTLGQIVRFVTYVHPALSAFYRVLIISQVVKAELTKIRQTVPRPFLACGCSLTLYLVPQRNFELEIVNIHDPGQEHWRNKYVYWIPALHIDGKEVAKGRWDGQTVTQALNAWQKTLDGSPEDSPKGQS
jgi:hypothetical protein